MAAVKNRKKTNNSKGRVLVALSGGVDSAVSAYKLQEDGFQVEAGHMVCWDEGPYCSADADRASATRVANALGIKLTIFDFRAEYKQKVVDYFVGEYAAGRTPNPDVACNKEIKFGIFFNKALELGFDFVATGHYARVEKSQKSSIKNQANQPEESTYKLLSGLDPNKDQSYFLYNLTERQLSKTLFPIGHLTKPEVRELAIKLGLPNAAKPDSQGICFVGQVEIKEFLAQRIPSKIGNIVNQSGEVLGKHAGVAFYTIGQREGLKISKNIPHYIVEKRTKTNTLVAAPFGDSTLYKTHLTADSTSWVGKPPKAGQSFQARIRYRQPLFEVKLAGISTNSVDIDFKEPTMAVTAGQALVLYDWEEVIGGGVIR